MAIATFGSKQFVVSHNKIYTIDDITFSQALNVELQDVEGRKPATYIKGVGLIPLSFSLDLNARFVDVKSEIDWWNNKMLSKVPEVFTIGGKIISRNKFLLKSVASSEITIGKNGKFIKAKLDLQFEEYAATGKKSNSKSAKKAKSKKKTKKETVHKMSAAAIKAIQEATKK
jgi:ribosomal protein L21